MFWGHEIDGCRASLGVVVIVLGGLLVGCAGPGDPTPVPVAATVQVLPSATPLADLTQQPVVEASPIASAANATATQTVVPVLPTATPTAVPVLRTATPTDLLRHRFLLWKRFPSSWRLSLKGWIVRCSSPTPTTGAAVCLSSRRQARFASWRMAVLWNDLFWISGIVSAVAVPSKGCWAWPLRRTMNRPAFSTLTTPIAAGTRWWPAIRSPSTPIWPTRRARPSF